MEAHAEGLRGACRSIRRRLRVRVHATRLQVGDSVMLDLETGKIKDFIKYDVGNLCVITGGHNNGRVGVIVQKEKHKGSFEIVHVEDAAGNRFATRSTNVFLIGKGNKPMISLPKGKGIKLTIIQEQAKKYASA